MGSNRQLPAGHYAVLSIAKELEILLLYRLKRRRRDCTTHVIFEPLELIKKLAAIGNSSGAGG
jgi:hypothetical protein